MKARPAAGYWKAWLTESIASLGDPVPDGDYERDFFVSHADADQPWAGWIATELERAGYGVISKAWDFRPGENRLDRHNEALKTSRHTICVLSDAYLESETADQSAAHNQALQGKERALIPVLVSACDVPPLLAPIIAIDLTEVDEDEARHRLLSGISERPVRVKRGGFPRGRANRVRFPGADPEVWELRGHRPDPDFAGRDDVLAELFRGLRAGRATSTTQAITGLGGQGKTRLVVEYAIRYACAYDLVWWIRAEDPATMRGDYVELAQELGLPSEEDDQAIAALRRELRRRRDWLLIFDNAEDDRELFPPDSSGLLPERHSGHVLVTSRRRDWPHAETLHLDVLPAAAAAGYLQRRGRMADSRIAAEIADALGCLPLALVQAASVIADGMRAADYLDLLRQHAPKLFAEGRTPDRTMTVATTWRVSVDRLARRSSAALALFRLSAFLAADAVPLARLPATALMPPELTAALADPIELSKATAALSEFSLAETSDGLLSIHRLVQAVTRAELGGEASQWVGIALAGISAAFSEQEQDPAEWPGCEELLAHALACAGHAVELGTDTIAALRLLDRVGRYLLARGRLDPAGAVLQQAFAAAGPLGHDDPVYLSCRNTYGRLLYERGDHRAARTVQEEVYQARTRVLGPEHPDTLRAGRDLVQTLYMQGHRRQAAQLHDRLVEAFTAALGPDDLETITARAYLATLLRDAGQYARARAIQEDVIEARVRKLGENHPDTLLARGNLAATLYTQGELEQARAIEEHVVAARTDIFGANDRRTLGSRSSLAATLYAQGELKQARAIREQVLEALTQLLGEDNRQTIGAKGDLAATLRGLGELKQARKLGEQALEAATRVLGGDDLRTRNTKANLAATLYALSELDEARALEEQVLEASITQLGEDHPRTLTAEGALATTLWAQGELDQARAMVEHVLQVRTQVLGEDHPDTVGAESQLAATLRELGDLDRARDMEEHVVQARIRAVGEDHPLTLAARADLALTRLAQGDPKEAISLLTECLDIAVKVFGKKHTVTTEAAWRLVENSPNEARRRELMVRYLSWLSREQPARLTASQKRIRAGMTGQNQPPAGRRPSSRPPRNRR
jgi:tetratricopeptide (TPR) repeat protein